MTKSDTLYWADVRGSVGLPHAWVSEYDQEQGVEVVKTSCGLLALPASNRWRERPKGRYCKDCVT